MLVGKKICRDIFYIKRSSLCSQESTKCPMRNVNGTGDNCRPCQTPFVPSPPHFSWLGAGVTVKGPQVAGLWEKDSAQDLFTSAFTKPVKSSKKRSKY